VRAPSDSSQSGYFSESREPRAMQRLNLIEGSNNSPLRPVEGYGPVSSTTRVTCDWGYVLRKWPPMSTD